MSRGGAPAFSDPSDLSLLLQEPRYEIIPVKGIEQKVTVLPYGSTVTVTVAGVIPIAGVTFTAGLAGLKANALPPPPGSVTVKVREIVLLSQKFPRKNRLGAEVVIRDIEFRKPTGSTRQ